MDNLFEESTGAIFRTDNEDNATLEQCQSSSTSDYLFEVFT